MIGDPPGGTFSGEGVSGNQFDPALAGSTGIYDVTYTYTDANGCTNSIVDYIEILENTVDAGEDVYIPEYTTTTLYATGGVSYIWTPGDSLSCDDCPDPVVDILSTTTFTVTSWDIYGCVATDEVTVHIVPVFDVSVFVPNTFTPNGDNINDMFFAYGSDLVTILSMRIYDRWGEEIYFAENISALDPSLGWDGSYRGQSVNEGVYVYMLEVLLEEGVRQHVKGNVTVIR
jgi:gliding motility-associated-like protein